MFNVYLVESLRVPPEGGLSAFMLFSLRSLLTCPVSHPPSQVLECVVVQRLRGGDIFSGEPLFASKTIRMRLLQRCFKLPQRGLVSKVCGQSCCKVRSSMQSPTQGHDPGPGHLGGGLRQCHEPRGLRGCTGSSPCEALGRPGNGRGL